MTVVQIGPKTKSLLAAVLLSGCASPSSNNQLWIGESQDVVARVAVKRGDTLPSGVGYFVPTHSGFAPYRLEFQVLPISDEDGIRTSEATLQRNLPTTSTFPYTLRLENAGNVATVCAVQRDHGWDLDAENTRYVVSWTWSKCAQLAPSNKPLQRSGID
jgi:hypothetical protein